MSAAAPPAAVDFHTPSGGPDASLMRTPLHALHRELGARMVPFAGYEMPVSYPAGIVAEHRQARSSAALFDVSHMGQIRLVGRAADRALETLVPVDVVGLAEGRQRYALFTGPQGGILDDLMVLRRPDELLLVVNASRKHADLAHLRRHIGSQCEALACPDRALLALQGPRAVQALARLQPDVAHLRFMDGRSLMLEGVPCIVTRSGYTGEDGFEISVAEADAEALARRLLAQPEVLPAGLGARDTLRLEAGLCLHGHDIDDSTTPVEAALSWAIQKVRRPGGERAGGYPGAAVVEAQLRDGPARLRIGLCGLERAPVREGASLLDADGLAVGRVTSGTLAPTADRAVALGYLPAALARPGATVFAEVRGRRLPLEGVALPFVPHRYHRG